MRQTERKRKPGKGLGDHPLFQMAVIGSLPFLFLLLQVLPTGTARIGTATALFAGMVVFALLKLNTKGYLLAAGLALPMYMFACLGFADLQYFTTESAMSRFAPIQSSSVKFWLGTDYVGRDILATLILGAKHAYQVALYTSITALLLGVPVGILLTNGNKIIKTIAFWITQFFEIIPQLFFVLIAMGVYNFWAAEDVATRLTTAFSLPIAGVAIGLSSLPSIARIVENRVNQLKTERFVTAMLSSNVHPTKVLLKNIVWNNCIPEIVVQTTFLFGSALLLESALSFAYKIGFGELGTGGYLSWGKMLAEARRSILFGENLFIIFPPIFITLISILGVNLLGDQLAKRIKKES